MRPPESLRWVLWDLDVNALDVERDADSILARVLENGRLTDVREVLRLYGANRVQQFFRTVAHPLISERTRAFWRCYFHAENEPWAEPNRSPPNNAAPWIG